MTLRSTILLVGCLTFFLDCRAAEVLPPGEMPGSDRKRSPAEQKEYERAVRKALRESQSRTTKITVGGAPTEHYESHVRVTGHQSSGSGKEQYEKYRREREMLRRRQKKRDAAWKEKQLKLRELEHEQKEKEERASKALAESENMQRELEERNMMQQKRQEELERLEADLSKWEKTLKLKNEAPVQQLPSSAARSVPSQPGPAQPLNLGAGMVIRETVMQPVSVRTIPQGIQEQPKMVAQNFYGQQSYTNYLPPGTIVTMAQSPFVCDGNCQQQKKGFFSRLR